MNYSTWSEILQAEGVTKLYPMTHFPQKRYSVFLISETSFYDDQELSTDEIIYEGSTTNEICNKKFFNLCTMSKSKKLSPPVIKIYHKHATNEWEDKGFYNLVDAVKDNGTFKFKLIPQRNK